MERVTTDLVNAGTFRRLNDDKKPNSFWAVSTRTTSTGRERTSSAAPSPPAPDDQQLGRSRGNEVAMSELSAAHARATMSSIPFCMGPLTRSNAARVEITESEYVCRRWIMTGWAPRCLRCSRRSGTASCAACTRGAPLAGRPDDVPWPCKQDQIHHHFRRPGIWGYGSATAATRCSAEVLRVRNRLGHRARRGWLAEHMLILKLITRRKRRTTSCRRFPSACGKTNRAGCSPPSGGARKRSATTSPDAFRSGRRGFTR